MGKPLFKTGYGEVEAEKTRQEKYRARSRGKLWDFFLTNDGDEAQVRFLTEEPVNYYAHSVQGKNGRWQEHICDPDDMDGDSRPQFKSAYLIWDRREFETTNERGKKVKKSGCLRLYTQGTKAVSQLARISSKSGITTKDLNIVRSGSGTNTSYMFETDFDKEPLTADEVSEMLSVLPEEQQEMYTGDVKKGNKSLLEVVMAQLEMRMDADKDIDEDDDSEYDESDGDDEEDERPARRSSKKTTKSTPKRTSSRRHIEEDDDDDEDEDDDAYIPIDEDEEEDDDDLPMNKPKASRTTKRTPAKTIPAKKTPLRSNKGRSKGLFK